MASVQLYPVVRVAAAVFVVLPATRMEPDTEIVGLVAEVL